MGGEQGLEHAGRSGIVPFIRSPGAPDPVTAHEGRVPWSQQQIQDEERSLGNIGFIQSPPFLQSKVEIILKYAEICWNS